MVNQRELLNDEHDESIELISLHSVHPSNYFMEFLMIKKKNENTSAYENLQ